MQKLMMFLVLAAALMLAGGECRAGGQAGVPLHPTPPATFRNGVAVFNFNYPMNMLVSTGSGSSIHYDSEYYDPLSTHSTTTNTDRIYVPFGYKWAQGICEIELDVSVIGTSPLNMILIVTNDSTGGDSTNMLDDSAKPKLTTRLVSVFFPVSYGQYLICKYINQGSTVDHVMASKFSVQFYQ